MLLAVEEAVIMLDTDGGHVVGLSRVRDNGDVGHVTLAICQQNYVDEQWTYRSCPEYYFHTQSQ